MRQIKFRVFDKNDGMFLVDGLVGTSKGMRVSSVLQIPEDCDPECYTLEPWEWEYSDDDVLMQFTGLKDKNGVEIYEGDILRTKNKKIQEVIFMNGFFQMPEYFIDETDEVIGNIYQNPELLESK